MFFNCTINIINYGGRQASAVETPPTLPEGEGKRKFPWKAKKRGTMLLAQAYRDVGEAHYKRANRIWHCGSTLEFAPPKKTFANIYCFAEMFAKVLGALERLFAYEKSLALWCYAGFQNIFAKMSRRVSLVDSSELAQGVHVAVFEFCGNQGESVMSFGGFKQADFGRIF